MINLDKAALNSPHPRVESSILRAISLHRPAANGLGLQSREFLQDCRSRIAGHLSRDEIDLSFFGSATAAIRFVASKLNDMAFSLFVPKTEHSCSLAVASHKLDVDETGQVISILDAISAHPGCDAIIISAKNNETGAVPSAKIRQELAIAQSQGARLIVDATGADWNDQLIKSADYVFASAGKWHGLAGMGVLFGTKDLWDDQATEGLGGVVGGSPNLIGISCLADAMDWIAGAHGKGLAEKNNRYLEIIDEAAASLGWIKNGSGFGVANYFTGIPSDLFVEYSSDAGLNISAGAACNSGINNASHVITAMFNADRASKSIRISWDRLTKESDLMSAMEIVKKVDNTLRAALPKGDSK